MKAVFNIFLHFMSKQNGTDSVFAKKNSTAVSRLMAVVLIYLFPVPTYAQSLSPTTKWHWDEGTIVVECPPRPVGQESALRLKAPKIENVHVAFVGLGNRGPGAVNRFCHIPGVQIVALCDYEEERAERCQRFLRETGLPPAAIYSGADGYKEMCQRNDIDLVYVATDWNHHFPVACCALENGKHVAIEVPAAMNLDQIWTLVNLCEKTRKHCMMLENCCYDYFEMTVLNMAQAGLFGELIRAEGAYIHYLNEKSVWKGYWEDPDDNDVNSLHWRMKYNKENRGDIYPTHGLGPVAQCLNIHRGDRFATLIAMDTESIAGREGVREITGDSCSDFRNGDHTTTLLRTARGKVVEIQHDVMTPQPYDRKFRLTGTKGAAVKYPDPKLFVDNAQATALGVEEIAGKIEGHNFLASNEYNALMKKYYHPILAKFGEMGREMGHGGMDYIMDARLVYCLQNGLPLDMDVYDLAEWCSLAELGALSMDHGCAPVAFPDFTRGEWNVQQGFCHAYATPEEETAAEAAAEKFTADLKEYTIKKKLWEKYDRKKGKK